MKIIEALLGEHGVFHAQFHHLAQNTPTAETRAWVQGQAALLAATLNTHASLEDELLFSTLEPQLGPMGPLAMMRMEHDQIEKYLAQAQDAQELGQAQDRLLQAVRVARDHFAKEEQVLFPLALRVLDEQTLNALGSQWASRRGVTASV